jgi:aspartate ammonia-lyase
MVELRGEGVLRVGVLAATPFENQLDLDVGGVPLLEVDDGGARAEVVAGILAGDRIDGVRPELAAAGGFGDGLTNLAPQPDLIRADRRLHFERGHAGVLADRPVARRRLIDVLRDDRQGLPRARGGLLLPHGTRHRGAHVRRQIGRGFRDQLHHAVDESGKHMEQYNPGIVAKFRVERDPLGDVRVPASAYYGAQTQRALDNFPISGITAHPELVTATIQVKKAAAAANAQLRRLPSKIAKAITAAADEVLDGQLRDHFVVDIYQAGAGTSHNMNANEVLANRAAEILGGARGEYTLVHPNDHVNMGQSTNDVYPTATRVALVAVVAPLLASARALAGALDAKARAFAHVLKTGRTHLQDAVPITLGQEFGGFAANVRYGADEVERTSAQLYELNLGATAVGTGLNAGDDYTREAIARLARYTGAPLRPADNRFRVTQSMGDVLAVSGAIRRLAVEVGKVASDLRLLSMGPRAGIAEIQLPPVQPGSSIMPGKVNPSVPEMVNQVCFQVIGCDAAVLAAADAGQLELNVMMPVIAWNALHATRILTQAMRVLDTRCVQGIAADEARCRELLDRSTALATALSPYIGYAATADLAKTSVQTGRPIRDLVRERGLLAEAELDGILSAEAMTSPGVPGKQHETTAPDSSHPRGDGRRTGRRGSRPTGAAHTAVPAGGPRRAGGTGSRRVAKPGQNHGRAGSGRGSRRR